MKNNLKKIIYVIVIIAITVLASIYLKDNLEERIENNQNTQEQLIIGPTETPELELQEAYVTKVIDGDTIGVTIDGNYYKVRLIGINCPEYTKEIEPYGKEATEYTNKMLYHKTIYLQKDMSDTDNYDRLLRYIWLDKVDTINEETIKSSLFNYELVINGLAHSNYYKPNITLQNYLEEAENYAKQNKIGMWE